MDETSTDVNSLAATAGVHRSAVTDVVTQNKTSQPVIELLSSDDDVPSSLQISVYKPSKRRQADEVSKSNSSQLRT